MPFIITKEKCFQLSYDNGNGRGGKGRKLTQWMVKDDEGVVRFFDTKRDAKAYVESRQREQEEIG